MAKLVAIGDSITQGFQSGAIYRTEWSYPTLIARTMGLGIPRDFPIPTFAGSGLPLNIEQALHWMKIELGSQIDTREWIFEFPQLLWEFTDAVEDLYEREPSSLTSKYGGFYHNLAVWGFRVADSWSVNGDYCQKTIVRHEGWIEDDFLGLPSASMYRTAIKVFNLKQEERNQLTQIGNLQKIVETEGTVENLILWFGANDCLGTVTGLEIQDMQGQIVSDDPEERRKYNLTDPQVFEKDFQQLIQEITQFIPNETKVFVGTVPHVTIPPITQGLRDFDGQYFEYYGRFFSDANNFNPNFHKHLTREEIKMIDERIDQFNKIIKNLVQAQGNNWHIVDISDVLDQLAVKRNNYSDKPSQSLIDYYAKKGITNHPLLNLNPVPSVLGLAFRNGRPYRGGLFSLDGVHPSTMGYGIIAEAFLEVMQLSGVPEADSTRLNWREIIVQDSLWQNPPLLWESVLSAAERNSTLWDVILRVIS